MNHVDASTLDDALKNKMIQVCADQRQFAYCPYSKFRVGAALLTESGRIFTGCNVENASYGLTICTERTAVVSAVSAGERKFCAMSVATDLKDGHGSPCGACRQFLAEFGLDLTVILVNPTRKTHEETTVAQLLPKSFNPTTLMAHQAQ